MKAKKPDGIGEGKTGIRSLPLKDIRADRRLHARLDFNQNVAEEYADQMGEGVIFPPLEVVWDGKEYWLWDGFHRFEAATMAELDTISVNVRTGTKEDAKWLAAGANKDHGLRRTNADKREAVIKALSLKPGESNGTIAGHVGVSLDLVNRTRKELEATQRIVESPTRTGRDGRTTNTANIGKGRKGEPAPEEEAEPEPPEREPGDQGGEEPDQQAEEGTVVEVPPAIQALQIVEHCVSLLRKGEEQPGKARYRLYEVIRLLKQVAGESK
jgi:ParB-like chromosome segregation protein Spo0J